MTNFDEALGRKARVNAIVLASVLLATSGQTEAQPDRKQLEPDGQQLQLEQQSQELEKQSLEKRRLEAWREAIIQVPRPKKGCFTASPPKMEWQEVPCVTAPPYPMVPRRGPKPFIIGGNGNEVSAEVPAAGSFISTGIGTFDSVTGVTSVSSPIGNAGAPVNDAYTLQLNTNFFTSTACAGSPNPNCRGWEQFVFANNSSASGNKGIVYIQYWLIQYNATCPAGAGWIQFQFTGDADIYCYRNSAAVGVPNNTPITNLTQLSLTGMVNAAGDSITFSDATTIYSTAGDNSVNAAAGWQVAEFNVFGYGGNSNGGGMATFNTGSTIVPRTRIVYGGIAAPNCVADGFTGETNNLNFGPTAPNPTGPGPAVLFTESSTGMLSNCAAATTVGDTHLATFGGLLYDFQASGDFVLAHTDSDFVVQARQVSGAPMWPNASINSAVATQMGKTRAAICLAPERLVIDGESVNLEDGKVLALPDGVDILREGNIYSIRGQRGDSVRAVLHNGWIDVSVGLGRWPVNVRGLLFNTDRFGIETRDGAVLESPVSFEDLYQTYGNSWRVPLKESLLSVCGEETKEDDPEKIFYARDLEPDLFRRARAICAEVGVTDQSLLDACTLDVTVIGAKTAADVFTGVPPPIAVLEPTP